MTNSKLNAFATIGARIAILLLLIPTLPLLALLGLLSLVADVGSVGFTLASILRACEILLELLYSKNYGEDQSPVVFEFENEEDADLEDLPEDELLT